MNCRHPNNRIGHLWKQSEAPVNYPIIDEWEALMALTLYFWCSKNNERVYYLGIVSYSLYGICVRLCFLYYYQVLQKLWSMFLVYITCRVGTGASRHPVHLFTVGLWQQAQVQDTTLKPIVRVRQHLVANSKKIVRCCGLHAEWVEG